MGQSSLIQYMHIGIFNGPHTCLGHFRWKKTARMPGGGYINSAFSTVHTVVKYVDSYRLLKLEV
jgi:hypothetical protein